MGSIFRKFKRKDEVEKRKYASDVRNAAVKLARLALHDTDEKYRRDIKTYNDAAIIVTAAASANVIANFWGKLNKKETRIEKYIELYIHELENFQGERSEAMAKAKSMLKDKWGIEFNTED